MYLELQPRHPLVAYTNSSRSRKFFFDYGGEGCFQGAGSAMQNSVDFSTDAGPLMVGQFHWGIAPGIRVPARSARG